MSAVSVSQDRRAADHQPRETPFWKQPAIWVTAMFAPLVYIIAGVVLWPANNYSAEVRIMVVTAGFISLLSAITGYWLAAAYKSTDAAKPSAPGSTTVVSPPGTTINNQTKD